ncbi:unnamed protein product [Xylocopa violacea]|uniref:Spaetzle domain-containing protein n=1 Tax=Xylocopa violacea TaxID=135666 RepID=A0ABP1NJY8_XYLVO
MVSAITSTAILLSLIFDSIHGNSELSLDQLQRNEYNLDNESPISAASRNDAQYSIPIAWKWPFNLKHLSPMAEISNRNILFPGIIIEPAQLTTETVPTCRGQSFCADVPNYPLKLVDTFLKNNPQYQNYKNSDEMDKDISLRNYNNDVTLCPGVEQIIYPKTGEAKSKTWMYILNSPNFTQGVRIETCMNEGESCKIIDDHTQGYETSCKQKYIYRQLTAATASGTVSQELFRFPASCCCHVDFIGAWRPFRVGRSLALRSNRNQS